MKRRSCRIARYREGRLEREGKEGVEGKRCRVEGKENRMRDGTMRRRKKVLKKVRVRN